MIACAHFKNLSLEIVKCLVEKGANDFFHILGKYSSDESLTPF